MDEQKSTNQSDMGIPGTSYEVKSTDDFRYRSDYHRFADFLGVDKYKRTDSRLSQKLLAIYDWAGGSEGKSEEDVLNKVEELRKSMGTSLVGEELTNFLFRRMSLQGHHEDSKQQFGEVKTTFNDAVQELVNTRLEKIKETVGKKMNQMITKTVQSNLRKTLNQVLK